MNLSLKQTRWCCEAVFALFAFIFLGVYNSDYLYKLQAENLFVGNPVFAGETLPQSAGLLVYVSKWLLQLCFYPLLGAFVAALGLLGIERLLSVLVKPRSHTKMLLLFVPSLLLMVAQGSAGYAIYENFDTSFFYSIELGMLVSLLVAVIGDRLMKKNEKIGFAVGVGLSILLHLVIGIFAPLALMLVGAARWACDNKTAIKLIGVGLVVALLVPFLETSLFQEKYQFVLLAPIPVPYFFNVFAASLLSMLTAVVVTLLKSDFAVARLEKIQFAAVALVVMLCAAWYCSYNDANYRTLLKMQHCTDKHDWDGSLSAAEKVERPTRAIAAYRYVALLETGKLAEQLFNFPVRYDTLNCPYSNIDPLIFYPDLNFYASQLNTSLFWSFEAWTNAHRSVGALKRYATIALIQGEKELALKYIAQLKQTLCYSSWAKEVEKYVGNPQAFFNENPIYGKIYSSQIPENLIVGTDDLPSLFMRYTNVDPENMERRLLLELYAKKTDNFMQDLSVVKGMYKQSMPQCMQELVCLYALNTKLDVRRVFPINPEVNSRVSNFVYQAKSYANDHEAGAEALKDYKGMYVYYLLFGNPYPSAKNIKPRK